MTAIDLLHSEADQARDIIDAAPPKLSKQQYLDFDRSMMAKLRFEAEAIPQRTAP